MGAALLHTQFKEVIVRSVGLTVREGPRDMERKQETENTPFKNIFIDMYAQKPCVTKYMLTNAKSGGVRSLGSWVFR